MNSVNIREIAMRTIRLEAEAVGGLEKLVDENFEKAVVAIKECKGRIVVTGIGKSAIVGQKIVATFNSTGTPSLFMHAADAIHGDLGMIQQEDVAMIISKSGESPEIKVLVPLLRNFRLPLIAMTGEKDSYLARNADYLLNTYVSQEACPNNLAPTSSTTVQMVMGDAMAIALMESKGFGTDDFAKFHPGGTLGKKLYLRVADLYSKEQKPEVSISSPLKKIIVEISAHRLGATAVTEKNKLVGIITDGDLRRMLEKNEKLENVSAGSLMSKGAKTISPEALAVDALDLMRKNSITQLPVVHNDEYLGFIHLHDLIKEGLI